MPNIESERFLKARVMLQIICNFFLHCVCCQIKPLLKSWLTLLNVDQKSLYKSTFFSFAILFEYYVIFTENLTHFLHYWTTTSSPSLSLDLFFIKKALHILSKPSFFLQIGFQSYCFTQALFHFGSYLVKKTSSSISRKKEVFKADSEQVLTWLGVLVHYWWKDLFELATTFTTWNRSTVHC